jgi:cytochrome c
MSGGLYTNKIAFCVLATGLAAIGLNEASHAFFHTAHHEQAGYAIDVPETPEPGADASEEPAGPVDYGVLLAAADVAAGEQVAVKCKQCHTLESGGGALQGPPLWGVMGRDIAGVAGFSYTEDMAALPGAWEWEIMDKFLTRPKAVVPGTAMNFVGLRKEADRINLMAYLNAQGSSLAIPAPLPASATAPAAPAEGAAVPPEGTDAGVSGSDTSPPVLGAPATTGVTTPTPAPGATPNSPAATPPSPQPAQPAQP